LDESKVGGSKVSKVNLVKFALIGMVVLVGVLGSVSCIQPTPTVEAPRMLPVVAVIPNVTTPKAKVDIVGANFEPGEKVRVYTLISVGDPEKTDMQRYMLGGDVGSGLIEVDESGLFQMTASIQLQTGIYPVWVYDENGEMIASTLLMVREVSA